MDKKDIIHLLNDVDLELTFTDIKEKDGNKIKESDELMDLFEVFWEHIQGQILEKLQLLEKAEDKLHD